MPRKSNSGLRRVCVVINANDYSRIQELFPEQSASAVVRALMRGFLLKVDKNSLPKEEALPEIDIQLEDINVGN